MSRRLTAALPAATVLVALAWFAPIFSQETQPAPAKPSVQSYVLDGMVIDSLTGEPISGAAVEIPDPRNRMSALTGPDGRFHFENISHARVGLDVKKPGYFWEKEPLQWFDAFIEIVQLGSESTQLVIKLVPAAVITGRVTDSDGSPVQSLSVGLFYSSVWWGQKVVHEMRGGGTDNRGEFRIDGLTPGTYYLKAGPSYRAILRPGLPRDADREGYPGTYYGGGREIESATAITLTPGQQVRVDFQIPREVFYQVSGSVAGVPPGSAFPVWFIGSNGHSVSYWYPQIRVQGVPPDAGITDAIRAFSVNVPAGHYVVEAYVPGDNGPQGIAVRQLDVNSDISGLMLTIGRPPTIPVDILPDRMLAGITLVKVSGLLVGEGRSASSGWGWPPDPSFGIHNLEPGTYRANIKVQQGAKWYVASARWGDVDLLTEDLTVSADAPLQPIEIIMRNDLATINGTISFDGRTAQGTVLLIPTFNPKVAVTIATGPTGQFQNAELPPGEYRAFAFDHVNGLEYASQEIMRKYSSGEQLVRVPPNGQVTVNLKLQKL